jgi:hypothetical protein
MLYMLMKNSCESEYRLLPEWIEEKFNVTKNLMPLLTRHELFKMIRLQKRNICK